MTPEFISSGRGESSVLGFECSMECNFRLQTRDTISGIDLVRNPTLPDPNTAMTHICAFRHALALDEQRVVYSPIYADADRVNMRDNVKEAWFPGSHLDM